MLRIPEKFHYFHVHLSQQCAKTQAFFLLAWPAMEREKKKIPLDNSLQTVYGVHHTYQTNLLGMIIAFGATAAYNISDR